MENENTVKMKAVIATQYGAPEVLQVQDVAMPTPSEKQVLIKVHAAAVTAADTMMRKGTPYLGRLFLGLKRPKFAVPGTGVAGIVEAVGNEVTRFKVGDKVYGENITTFGTYAEYVCIDEAGVIEVMPENMTFAEGAGACDGGVTSMNFLQLVGKIQPGQKVLINGASGSLGTAAVQLAKAFGAEVTGVCSSSNEQMVKALGADHVIAYDKVDFTKTGKTYDIIYDTVGKLSYCDCRPALTKKGSYISPVLSFSLLIYMLVTSIFSSKKAKFSATGMLPLEKLRPLFKQLTMLFKQGKIKSVVDRSFPLAEIADAHRYVDLGHKKGNVVLSLHQ